MAPSGGGTGTGDWKTDGQHYSDARESNFLFQQLSMALQKGNVVSFQNTFTAVDHGSGRRPRRSLAVERLALGLAAADVRTAAYLRTAAYRRR